MNLCSLPDPDDVSFGALFQNNKSSSKDRLRPKYTSL
jgi:hypothetical protein